MTRRSRLAVLACGAAALAMAGVPVWAASHREAPFITELPKVDGTDLYMFRSYEPGRAGFVTFAADYIPFQDPFGGPNFYTLDPDALYEIHVDNDGDAREDVTFQFRFQNRLKNLKVPAGNRNVSVPVINVGQIGPGRTDTENLNVIETYTVSIVRGDRRSGRRQAITNAAGDTGAGDNRHFLKPVDNIGKKTIPDYDAYAADHIYDIDIPGCDGRGRVFVGQRNEPFVINVGEAFDLFNLNPLGSESGEPDNLADKNITSLILEVPISCLTDGNEPVIGAWTTASLPQARLLNPKPRFSKGRINAERTGGAFTQVSRIGMPLVNELVIGIRDKDRFNASRPRDDAQFLKYVTNPTVPVLLNTLFGNAAQPPKTPRNDLVMVFLTGVDNLNKPAHVRPAEMLRLNTSIAPVPRGSQNRLGVIGGDNAGYPNGRRPGDDVVDITLRVAMGKLLPAADAPSGQSPFTDGAIVDSGDYDSAFPYIRTPIPGSPNGSVSSGGNGVVPQ